MAGNMQSLDFFECPYCPNEDEHDISVCEERLAERQSDERAERLMDIEPPESSHE